MTHVEPLQHPDGQVVESQPVHARLVQVWPPAHVAHVAPALPHEAAVLPGRQVVP